MRVVGDLDEDPAACTRGPVLEPAPDGRQRRLVARHERPVHALRVSGRRLRSGDLDRLTGLRTVRPARRGTHAVAHEVHVDLAGDRIPAPDGVGAHEQLRIARPGHHAVGLGGAEGLVEFGMLEHQLELVVHTVGPERLHRESVRRDVRLQLFAPEGHPPHPGAHVRHAEHLQVPGGDREDLDGAKTTGHGCVLLGRGSWTAERPVFPAAR